MGERWGRYRCKDCLENMGTHPLGKLDKLKRVGGYLINWMISVGSCGDRPFKMQRACCALYGWG